MTEFIRLYRNVTLPNDAFVDDFVILGKPPRGAADGEFPLRLGAGCVIRSHSVIYAGNTIGDHFQCGHNVTIREHNSIGTNVSIGTNTIIEHHIQIGHHVRLHGGVFVPEYSVLEDHCWLGPGVVITNARYPMSKGVKEQLAGATIERGAIIGAGAVLLPGIRIGERAIVGAGAVVTANVAAGAVVVGSPARVVNTIDKIDAYEDYLR